MIKLRSVCGQSYGFIELCEGLNFWHIKRWSTWYIKGEHESIFWKASESYDYEYNSIQEDTYQVFDLETCKFGRS